MVNFATPQDELKRLQALWRMRILDTEAEPRFDRITKRATVEFDVPISTISLIDKDREWYKSCQGVGSPELPREVSFCSHAILSRQPLIVEDTLLDPRFSENPQVVQSPRIRFYAGVPLRDPETGLLVGVFCIKDVRPRTLSKNELNLLFELAKAAEEELRK